jgi:hypothetical protein
MQKQNEQISILTRRFEEAQRAANEEHKKHASEFELLGKRLAKIHVGEMLEISSLEETTHSPRDQSVLREPPPVPQTPPQLSEDRTVT